MIPGLSMSSISGNSPLSALPIESVPKAERISTAAKQSYGQILKSSALVGGSSALNIAIGIVRTKVMAMLLGPSGVGLAGLYGSVLDLTQSIAGMGINSSGVRQIAEAAGSGDKDRIARTAVVLRRISTLLGVLGAVLLVVFSRQISTLTFGSDQQVAPISLLSVAVLFRLVSAGQGALVQGMRRIADLAKMGVLGALSGTLIGVPVIYFLREKGVVPSLVGVAAMMIVTSWWYSRKIHIDIQNVSITASQVWQEATALLKLGFAFMASALMMLGSAYAIRILVLRELGFEATGFYQSAWTLGGLYVGFILQAMGADFYPRLTAIAWDNIACNRMVNEQARVGILLAGPGVIATLTFAPLVTALFYTAKFGAAVPILRWICLGITLRVITWPMGFIIVANGRQGLFFCSDLAWTIVHVGLAWICVRSFGLSGAGIAFFGSYVFHGFLIYPIVRSLSGFRWSTENRRTGLFLLSLIAVVFCGFFALPLVWAICVGTLGVVLSSAYSIRSLLKLISTDRIPPSIKQLLTTFGFIQCPTERLPGCGKSVWGTYNRT
jgi:antigen flippase